MKTLSIFIFSVVVLLAAAGAQVPTPTTGVAAGGTNTAGRHSASLYGDWAAHNLNVISAGPTQVFLDTCFFRAGTDVHTFFPLSTIGPVQIIDGANSETVTPSAVITPRIPLSGDLTQSGYTCSFTATFAFAHALRTPIVSGDDGLEEAINDAHAQGGGVVVVDSSWVGCGNCTTAFITGPAIGFSNVPIEDVRVVSGNTRDDYKWDGNHYVLVVGGSVVGSFAAGNLPPLFTTTVTDPNSNPVLNFFQSTALAHTVFGNNTGSTGLPVFFPDLTTIVTTAPIAGGASFHLGDTVTISCPTCGTGTGSVSSVAQTNPNGILSQTGGPITVSGTFTWLWTGTSGGVPCFTSTSSMGSSALLGTNQLVLGGGAAVCPSGLGSLGTTTTVLHGNASGAPSFGPVVPGDLSTAAKTRTCLYEIGSDNGPVLATADIQPQKSTCHADVTATVFQILVKADAGASTIQIGYRHSSGGAPTTTAFTAAVLTPATVTNVTDKVACANTGGTAINVDGVSVTCSTLQNTTWTLGDSLETVGGAADGTTKRVNTFVTYTAN